MSIETTVFTFKISVPFEKWAAVYDSDENIQMSSNLKICADTNAVPPSGIAGVDVMDSGKVMEKSPNKCRGIGALAIGNVKYKSQHECLKLMYTSDDPVYLDFEDAFKFAQKSV